MATRRTGGAHRESDEIGPAIFRLRFARRGRVLFHEGQHAVIELPGGLRRCYSMSNRPGTTTAEFITEALHRTRVGSEAISALSPGDEAVIEMPTGDVGFRDTDAPIPLHGGRRHRHRPLSWGTLRRLAPTATPLRGAVVYGANIYDELCAGTIWRISR